MKKMLSALALAAAVSSASAKDLYSSEEHPVTVAALALAAPIQLPPSNWDVRGVRFDLVYGDSHSVYGIDLGLVGHVGDAFSGIQLGGMVDWVEGDVYGLQLAGIANVAGGAHKGVQLASAVNVCRGEFYGVQFGGVNHNGTFYGWQTGVFNYDKGISWGLQLGLANSSINEWHGWSLGLVNYADRMSGFQLGAVNIAEKEGRGVQIGVFNAADKFNGVQIGVLNIIGKGEMPVMPVLNANF